MSNIETKKRVGRKPKPCPIDAGRLQQLFDRHHTIRRVSGALKQSPSLVSRWAGELGVTRTPRITREHLLEVAQKHQTLDNIGRALHMSDVGALYWLKKYGIARNRRGNPGKNGRIREYLAK